MAENTAIEWTDHTFNPWEGCTKVGPGCDHCYAEARNARYSPDGQPPNWGPGAPRRRTSETNWRQPLKWAKNAEAFGWVHLRRQRVFCASLADVFDNEVDPLWRRDLFDLIAETPELDWLLLTKRIGNVEKMIAEIGYPKLPDHVWLGATIVNQAEADRDIPKLLAVPASIRFLSMEPLLGPVDLVTAHKRSIGKGKVDWVIVGGESGKDPRPMHPEWAASIGAQCIDAGVPFLFKQWGAWAPWKPGWPEDKIRHVASDGGIHYTEGAAGHGGMQMILLGKKHAGRLLGGRTWDGVPRT